MTEPIRRRRATADVDVLAGPTDDAPAAPSPADSDVLERMEAIRRTLAPTNATVAASQVDPVRDEPVLRSIRRAIAEPTQAERIRDRGAIVETDDGGREVQLEPIEVLGDPRQEADKSTPATSFVRGLGNTVAFGQMPRIMAGIDAIGGADYDTRLQDWQRHYRHSQEDEPAWSAAGTATGVLGSILAPAGPAGRFVAAGATPASRIGRAALTSGAIEAVPAALDSDADTLSGRAMDVAERAIPAALLGTAGSGIAEIARLSRDANRLRAAADSLDEAAAPMRVRSAGARTLGFQRLVEDLPGGQQRAAQVLDETGIMPRGTMLGSVDDALERARAAESRSGSRIGNVRRAMDLLSPDSARGLPSLDEGAARAAGQVDPEPLAQAYEDIARRYQGVTGAESIRDSALSLAGEVRANGPMTFEQAQTQKQFLDSMINWADERPGQRLRPLMENRQEVRRALARSMDEAVAQDIGPAAAQDYQRARQQYQVANMFRRFGDDSAMRDSANRLVSPSDYAAGLAGAAGEAGSGIRGFAAVVANRLMRGREASLAAGTMERMADAARRLADRDPNRAWISRALVQAQQGGPRALGMAIQQIAQEDPTAAEIIAQSANLPATPEPELGQLVNPAYLPQDEQGAQPAATVPIDADDDEIPLDELVNPEYLE